MDKLVYYTTYPLLWLVSLLPFPLLYGLSNLLYYLLFYVVGYRKRVVYQNLKLAFPEKTERERKFIARKFYRHLADIFMEMIKGFTVTRKQLLHRMVYTNLELLRELEQRYSTLFIMQAHYASWEWTLTLNNYVEHQGYAIYQPIANKYFDRTIRRSREKLGAELLSIHRTREIMQINSEECTQSIYGVVSDQSPTLHRAAYWGDFFGIRVPIHIGAEKLAKKWGIPVVFIRVNRIRRGYYEATFELLSEDPRSIPDFELSERFMNKVEEAIRERPELYFWTHKRWKHRGKERPDNSINYPTEATGGVAAGGSP